MTIQEIKRKVDEGANLRFGDTIAKVMEIVRNHHTHQSWTNDCNCEYCNFITGPYINARMYLHKLKKKARHFEYLCFLTEDEMCASMSTEMLVDHQREYVKLLRKYKQALKQNII